MFGIPHPYEKGMAEQWFADYDERYEKGEFVRFAIIRRWGSALIGSIGLGIKQQHAHAELGYWIGKTYWNSGYATKDSETNSCGSSLTKSGFRTLLASLGTLVKNRVIPHAAPTAGV